MSAEEKLDKILSDVAAIADKREASQCDLNAKLNKLEQDMTASQEDATKRALKRSRRDRPTEFNRRGHKEQFDFNEEVDNRLDAATKKMRWLAPSEADKKLIQEAIDELQEDMRVIAKRQKHIRIAGFIGGRWMPLR